MSRRILLAAALLAALASPARAHQSFFQTVWAAVTGVGRAGQAAAQAATQAAAQTPPPSVAPSAAVSPGTLITVNAGTLRYQWARNGITIDFRDRNGSWTDAEALLVRDALDKLPDLYLQKAITGGLQQIYRDGHFPDAPWQFIEPPHDPLHAVAVPVAPWNCIAIGDNIFSQDAFLVYRVIAHELGHMNQWNISGWSTMATGTPGFTDISWSLAVPYLGMKRWNGFVTDYARTNQFEDFAETAKFYWIAPDELLRVSPEKFAFMRDVVFEKLVSPAASRSIQQLANQPVGPAIASLGSTSADWLAPVAVNGAYFMAAWDGGSNGVTFRGTWALNVPVSHTTLYATVPTIGKGPAPVAVTTPDGTSADAAFDVTEPWWKFW